LTRIRSRLSYANVMATLAVFMVLGGGAYAASHLKKNSVNSSAIKNGQVKTKDLAKNAVVSSKIKNGQVGSADITDGGVGASDVAPAEGFHLVGQPGEPTFGNGGDGDCLWSNISDPSIPPGTVNPVSFYKDPYGRVHLNGIAEPTNGSGGDAACDSGDPGDETIFTLPPADRPAHLELLPVATTGNVIIVGAATDKAFSTMTIPAGAVLGDDSAGVSLDGASFRAVGPGNNLRQATGRSTADGAAWLNSVPAAKRLLK
jgi:hypothetical protein